VPEFAAVNPGSSNITHEPASSGASRRASICGRATQRGAAPSLVRAEAWLGESEIEIGVA